MIEKDTIQELFSKAFENQTAPVRPELWAGVQAKMAAAGVASTATVATKGLSALTKWLIGSAAVGTVGVVTTVIALNSGQESTTKKNDTRSEVSQNVQPVSSMEDTREQAGISLDGTRTRRDVLSDKPVQTASKSEETQAAAYHEELVPEAKETAFETPRAEKTKQPDPFIAENPKRELPEKREQKESKKESIVPESKGTESNSARYPENTDKQVFADLEAKVTKFPNVFSPNNDHENDVYFVKAENIVDFQLLIIDQNNREMFLSNTPGESDGWNGRDQAGNEAPNGSYAAIVTGKDKNGKSFRDIQLFELRR